VSTVTSPDGTVIDYDRYGDGPAVIFIGGASAYRATDEGTTQTAGSLAAEGYTTVDYDRSGRGRSGGTQPWALDREVEDAAGLIKAAGGAAALCTNSSGADIAMAAVTAGAGVTALVLYEPPFFAGPSLAAHKVI
jgi:pimeloyl-ACP methyl ester carboxylesterase